MNSEVPYCTGCTSRNCFINMFANDITKRMLARKKAYTVYKKGEVIIRQGTPVSGIYFIHTGKVKVYITGNEDRVQIVRLAGSGSIIGHRGIGHHMLYPISTAAMDVSGICFIPIGFFMDALHRNNALTLNLLMVYADEMKKAEYKLLYSNQMTVRQRMAHTLLYLRDVFGIKKSEGLNYLNVQISRKELSEIIGCSIEELIRTMSLMNKEGLIRIDSKRIALLKPEAVREIISKFPTF